MGKKKIPKWKQEQIEIEKAEKERVRQSGERLERNLAQLAWIESVVKGIAMLDDDHRRQLALNLHNLGWLSELVRRSKKKQN